jgi:hypothetical protein
MMCRPSTKPTPIRPPKDRPWSRSPVRPAGISDAATAMTTTAMYPNNDTLGERLRLYVEQNFHNA